MRPTMRPSRATDLVGAKVSGGREGSGRAFVLVHGIGVSHRYFRPLARELREHGDVWLVDLPGFGSAPKPERDLSIRGHASQLGRFLEENGIRDPVLVGHSMGTQVVSQLAADRPELADRIVLIGPTADENARTVRQLAWRMMIELVRAPLWVKRVVTVDFLIRCGPPYYFRQLPHLLEDRIESRLADLTQSVLVVRGDRDPICPPDWVRRVAALTPRGRFVEVPGTHVAMYPAAGELAAAIVEESVRWAS